MTQVTHPNRTRRNLRIGAALLVGVAGAGRPAEAVLRSCGADPVANTAQVLCASPSGPCDAALVRLAANIEVTNAGCRFDLGGRSLLVTKTFQMRGDGFIAVDNAGDITITATGKLKARGDFDMPGGVLVGGGAIDLDSGGAITLGGLLDVYGDPGGTMTLTATGDVVLLAGSFVRGVGNSLDGTSEHFADGGDLEIASDTGSVRLEGDIYLDGQVQAQGGDALVRAARNINVTRALDASGGGDGGGSITLLAGDDITITKPLIVESDAGGGAGGAIVIAAGLDALGGVLPGGSLTVQSTSLQLDGSTSSGGDEDGGALHASASGSIRILGTGSAVRASAHNLSGGGGGIIDLDAGGDIVVEGPLVAAGGGAGGGGGHVSLTSGAGVSLSSAADVTLTGTEKGGNFTVRASDAYAQSSAVLANASAAGAQGGEVSVTACALAVNGTARLEANGALGGDVELVGHGPMAIATSAQVRATGTGGRVELRVRSFGTCSNDASRHCRTNAECTIGCSTGTCQNVNPDTGGATAQFAPAPIITEDQLLASCP